MKTKIKLLKGLLIGALLLATNFLVAQTNTSPVQTVCAGSIAEPYLINPPTAGSTYQWSLSGGGTLNNGLATDNITVDWGITPGTYTITVIETDVNGCDGAPVTVDVTVLALPSPTVASSQTACLGGIIPDLFAVGSAPNWYTDIALTNNVFSGNSFPTGETAVGLYTYYVTETLNGCEGDAVPVTLEIYSLPTSPVAANEVVCEGSAIPDLTATGTSVVWYSDAVLTTVVGNGSTFATGQSTAGVYTYYVTQNDGNGCESSPSTVTLEIYSLPTSPVATNEVVCEGSAIPDLTATGASVVWYSDAALTTVVGNGSSFATGQSPAGVYTYYVTQNDGNGCESSPSSVTLEIYSLPTSPVATNEVGCEGGVIPDLTATGTSVVWYSDIALTTVVGNGSSFATGQSAAGVYTYYATQGNVNGCEGPATIVTLTISPFGVAPSVTSQSACFGSAIPDLTATGTSVVWYSDRALTTVVGNGSAFATGQSAAGVYTYYATQNIINGCESNASTVTLEIYALPITGPINHW